MVVSSIIQATQWLDISLKEKQRVFTHIFLDRDSNTRISIFPYSEFLHLLLRKRHGRFSERM